MAEVARTSWTNWSGTEQADNIEQVRVRDVDHLREVVSAAHAQGRRVRPVGMGHSFTGVARPVDIQVDLGALSGVVAVDSTTSRARVRAGTRLADAGPQLHAAGVGLSNQGDYDRQTLAGATSTGTHGTGARLVGFSGAVRGVEMVLADGSLMRVDDQHDADLLPAVALSLGALGVITEIDYQCEPAYLVTASERPARLTDVLESLDQRLADADHFEFFWFPDTPLVLAKTGHRHRDADRLAPLAWWKDRLDNDILSNRVFEQLNRLATRVPRLTAPLNQISARALSAKTFTDWSHTVFPTARDVRFRESELAVPREVLPEFLTRLESWHRAHRGATAFPVEVRFAASDDVWLSTAHERDSAYIAIHQFHRRSHDDYFQAFWQIASAYAPRPHWGKLHPWGVDELREVWPRLDDFVAVRDRLDPDRMFTNPYLDRVLGS